MATMSITECAQALQCTHKKECTHSRKHECYVTSKWRCSVRSFTSYRFQS